MSTLQVEDILEFRRSEISIVSMHMLLYKFELFIAISKYYCQNFLNNEIKTNKVITFKGTNRERNFRFTSRLISQKFFSELTKHSAGLDGKLVYVCRSLEFKRNEKNM